MPLYDYQCNGASGCGFIDENRKAHPDEMYLPCPRCGQSMKRLLHAQFGICMGAAGAHGYYDETLQTYIHTNRQRREEMRRQGVTEKGATPKNEGAWV